MQHVHILKQMLKIKELKQFFLHQSRAITLLLFDKIFLSAIRNNFPIPTLIQSLTKKIKKMLETESGNKNVVDI